MEARGRGNLLRIAVEVDGTLFSDFENTTMDAIFDEPAQVAFSKI